MTTPPFIPGTRTRFRSPGPRVRELERMMRERVQEGAPGLYLFEVPARELAGTPMFSLVEAYHPEGIRNPERSLDPYRLSDYQAGNLVAVGTVGLQSSMRFGSGLGSVYVLTTLTDRDFEELRRNNRNARAELKRRSSAHARAKELRGRVDAEEAETYREFEDEYANAVKETHWAMKPKVSVL